ncbi:MAG: 3-oxoacyl-[acyl-carrier-protein] reductase [Armatimonadota bacterium]|nr:3-oxoacyl-[acyl-carrier-protein] reductase [Armatimonadota bacterium]
MELEGKVALVTGAGRAGKGIGRSICLALAKQGAKIAIADFVPEAAESVANEIREIGVEAMSFKVDVADTLDTEHLVESVVDKFGKIDILVNNAGITRDQLLLRMSEAEWDAVIDTNLKGTFNCTKAVAKLMLRARTGRIVNIASVMGLIGNPGQANYSASKAGVIGFTKTVAKELGSRGITVNAVAPGFIETVMTEELSQQVRDTISAQIPLARLGTPEDVANIVVFLCSEASNYVTGQVINVDGGMVM